MICVLAATPRPGEAERDGLTGALSRRLFLRLLEREVLRADETGESFALCLADVDELRKINARAGLRAGDAVLAGVADAIRHGLGEPGWRGVPNAVARYDGDALAVMLREPRSGTFTEFAERLAARMSAGRLMERMPVTVSVAVVRYEFGESVDELTARLERTSHVGKQFGRGRVEVAPRGGWERATSLRATAG